MQNYSIQIEQSVLATLIDNYDKFEKYHTQLKPETFFYEANQSIYSAMQILYKDDKPIDADFIRQELDKQGTSIDDFLIAVITSTPTAVIEKYIKQLQEAHKEREALSVTTQLREGKISVEQLQTKLSKIQNLYDRVENNELSNKTINLDKLSPFLKDVITDLHSINEHPINMILSTVLTSMGGLIGARAKVTNGMFEVYPVIWSIIVAPSSLATKSTLTRYTKKCIFGELQDNLFVEYRGKLEKYQEEKKAYNNLSKEDKRNEIEPEKPEPQLLIFQNDGTPEAKLKSLEDNPNGGVVYYDEMKAELEKTNNDKSYKALKTSTFDGDRFHKRLVNGGSIILEHPILCENGLITEQWLLDVIHKDDIVSGFMARFLFSYNKKEDFKPLQIKPLSIKVEKYAKVGEFIIEMLELECKEPNLFNLTLEARNYYTNWFNDLSDTIFYTETDEEITSSYRLTTYVLKFALISYIFDMAYQENNIIKSGSIAIPLKYIKEAIYLFEIFRDENDKVLALFQKNNKLHKTLDDISMKLQNKIRATKDKRISKTNATNSIRGLNAKKLDEFIEKNLFRIEQIDRVNYIFEC
ncbi:MAG: DUF3987 domain-containing protein [Arcobacteraceae bacterium]|nr:DUF3987 domain-containing protein [Arcobacteraceae bacterium]